MSEKVKHVCLICGWEFDESEYGKWEDLPENFECPECFSDIDLFDDVKID